MSKQQRILVINEKARSGPWVTHAFPLRDRRLSGASGHSNKSDGTLTGPGSIVNLNPQVPTVTQAETLRQKAFAKLRMFNFSLNWDLHMNQCK